MGIKIKSRKYDGMLDRRLATAAIVSTSFLRGIVSVYDESLVEGDLLRTVLRWCVEYLEKHGEAPGQSIQDIFTKHYKRMDPDLAEDVGAFLEGLSREYEDGEPKLNSEYLLKQAEDLFRARSLKRLTERIQIEVEDGELEEAEQALTEHRIIRLSSSSIVNPFDDPNAIRNAFEFQSNPLLSLPGALGKAINDQFCRDNLVGIMGREKIGKTWTLMEIAMRGLRAGLRVLFVQAGDMSKHQQIIRFGVRLAGRSNKVKYCGDVLLPVLDCWHNQTGECDESPNDDGVVEDGTWEDPIYLSPEEAEGYQPCTKCEGKKKFRGAVWRIPKHISPLTADVAIDNGRRFMKANGADFRLSCHPMYTLTMRQIQGILHRLEVEDGFTPDLIIIDYADILAPEDPRRSEQDNENMRWMLMRRMSQEQKCCVVTGTQADADSYTKKTLTMKNFSRDKRKFAHVTSMLGLNQLASEKARGLLRVNQIVVREDDYDTRRCVHLVQSLTTGRPLIASF